MQNCRRFFHAGCSRLAAVSVLIAGVSLPAAAFTSSQDILSQTLNAATSDQWSATALMPNESLGSTHARDPIIRHDSTGQSHILFGNEGSTAGSQTTPANVSYRYFNGSTWVEESLLTISDQLVTEPSTVTLSFDFVLDDQDNPAAIISYNTDGNSNQARTLVYATRNAGAWTIETVNPSSGLTADFVAPSALSLALDSQGTPYAAYRYNGNMLYLTKTASDWHVGCVATNANFNGGILIDSTDVAHAFYTDNGSNNLAVYYATASANPNACWSSSAQLVHEDASQSVGFGSSGAMNNLDQPQLTYTGQDGTLYLSQFDGLTWQSTALTNALYASDTDIAITSTNTPVIAYFKSADFPRTSAHQLSYLAFDGQNWTDTVVLSGINRNPISLSIKAGTPTIALSVLPYYTENSVGHGAGWTTATVESLSDPWYAQNGFTVDNMTPYIQPYTGIALIEQSQKPAHTNVPFVSVTTRSAGQTAYLEFENDGTFKSRMPSGFDTIGNMHATVNSDIDITESTAIGDFDNDGLADLLIAGRSATSGSALIEFHKKASEQNLFDSNINSPAVIVASPSDNYQDLHDMAAADFNNDGFLDFVVSGSPFQAANVKVYFGNGDGTFSAPVELIGNNVPYGIDAEDIDGDGNADFAVVGNYYTSRVDLYLGDGNGQFALITAQLDHIENGRQTAQGITLSDFDGDTLVDMVLTNYADSTAATDGLAFYHGNGDGSFSATPITSGPEIGPGTSSNTQSRSIDNDFFNDDETMDLIIADRSAGEIFIYAGNGDGSFTLIPQKFYSHPSANTCGSNLCLLDLNQSIQQATIVLPGTELAALSTDVFSALSPKITAQAPVADAGADQSVHVSETALLDGSGSSDSDQQYPLSFAWEILSAPASSNATLSDSTSAQTDFVADTLGDFIISLIITDAAGNASQADTVLISTLNTAPIADAGENQSVTLTGSTVTLDGTQSWDDDGDTLSYQWSIVSKPPASTTALNDTSAVQPTFVVDQIGEYTINLVVSDSWSSSAADIVTISFENITPIANAGDSQSVFVGDVVSLDGSGSSDDNGDTLTYSWQIVAAPAGSSATLQNSNAVLSTFVADNAGEFVIGLTANDGTVDSAISNITVVASTYQSTIVTKLNLLLDTVNAIPKTDFRRKKQRKKFANRINSVINKVDKGKYSKALRRMEKNLLRKVDGCSENGVADKRDWLQDCTQQVAVENLVLDVIELLEDQIAGQ